MQVRYIQALLCMVGMCHQVATPIFSQMTHTGKSEDNIPGGKLSQLALSSEELNNHLINQLIEKVDPAEAAEDLLGLLEDFSESERFDNMDKNERNNILFTVHAIVSMLIKINAVKSNPGKEARDEKAA